LAKRKQDQVSEVKGKGILPLKQSQHPARGGTHLFSESAGGCSSPSGVSSVTAD